MKSLLRNKLFIFIILALICFFGINKLINISSKNNSSNSRERKGYSVDVGWSVVPKNNEKINNPNNNEYFNIIVPETGESILDYTFELKTDNSSLESFSLCLYADFKPIPFTVNSKEYTKYDISSNTNESISVTVDNKYLYNNKILISSLLQNYSDSTNSDNDTIKVIPINLDSNFKYTPTKPNSYYSQENLTIDIADSKITKDKITDNDITLYLPKSVPNNQGVLVAAYIDDKLVQINDNDFLFYEFNSSDNALKDKLIIDKELLKNGDNLRIMVLGINDINKPLENFSICEFSKYYTLDID